MFHLRGNYHLHALTTRFCGHYGDLNVVTPKFIINSQAKRAFYVPFTKPALSTLLLPNGNTFDRNLCFLKGIPIQLGAWTSAQSS